MEGKIERRLSAIDLMDFQNAVHDSTNVELSWQYYMYDEFTGKQIHLDGGDIVFVINSGNTGYIKFMDGWLYLNNVPDNLCKYFCFVLDAQFSRFPHF